MLFPQGIYQLAETLVSVGRIQKFMSYEEIDEENKGNNNNNNSQKPEMETKNNFLKMRGVYARWDSKHPEHTLNNFNLEVDKPMLVAIIGPVGSGKSSVIQTILRELKLESGSIDISGTISYSSQEPWLFSASIRQNILFGLPMDRERYKKTVKICALERDFTLFEKGDKTIVGERGTSLSGGQKARINLARAIYRKADIYLLDDPLSAVDSHVGRHLFNECIKKVSETKITILITHQIQYLQDADKIILMDKGKVSAVGDYDTLSKSGLDFTKLLATTEEESEEKQQKNVQRQVSKMSTVSESSENAKRASVLSHRSIVDEEVVNAEKRDEGSISFDVCILKHVFFISFLF